MGDFGMLPLSAYSLRRSPESIEKHEAAVSDWLATRPGSFSARGACDPYSAARAKFMQHSGRQDERDDFEIALARLGYRAGVVTYAGNPLWILILPSSLDTALERMAAMESRP